MIMTLTLTLCLLLGCLCASLSLADTNINNPSDGTDNAKEECTIAADGSTVCVAVEEEIDFLEHFFAEKDHDCEDVRSKRDCQIWMAQGECTSNLGFMTFNCAHSCGYCHMVDPKRRCVRHPRAPAAVSAGDVNRMFERLLTDFPEYTPEVLSRDPWLVVLNNVLTDEETAALIRYGGRNWQRSKDAGAMSGDDAQFEAVVSSARTSETDWCTHDCWQRPLIQSIANKAANLTLIPKENSEFFQVLKYNVGQYYVMHHDYIYGHLDLPIGPRVYTFFIYLNTPEEGGETKFNDIGKSVTAERGKVAIWPSVLDSDPFEREDRTHHEALPVRKGIKFAANMWLHMYNFHEPYKITCTG